MFTVPWASPASLRYLLAADLKKEDKHLDPNRRAKEILVYAIKTFSNLSKGSGWPFFISGITPREISS